MAITLNQNAVGKFLTDLIGRPVDVAPADSVAADPSTFRGLVTDDNRLVAVIGADLEFAHRSAAALAMVPAGTLANEQTSPNDDLLFIYSEVANVLSRMVNEALPQRVRLDPNLSPPTEVLQQIVDGGSAMSLSRAAIEGYGQGQFGIWLAS